jgi:hypothetical protein
MVRHAATSLIMLRCSSALEQYLENSDSNRAASRYRERLPVQAARPVALRLRGLLALDWSRATGAIGVSLGKPMPASGDNASGDWRLRRGWKS